MAHDNPENKQWASDEDYTEKAYDTKDLQLPRCGDWIRVVEVPPMKMAEMSDEYDLKKLGENLEGREDVTFGDVREGNVDLPDNILEDIGGTVEFIRDIVVPSVIRPKNAHWNDPPTDPNATEVFDISSLHEDDLDAVIDGVSAEQPEERQGDIDEEGNYQGRFPQQRNRH